MDKNMVNRIWTYYSAMRGMAHSSNMVSAVFIAKKYLDEYGYNVSEIGQEAAYETMLALADKQGVNNPFENPFIQPQRSSSYAVNKPVKGGYFAGYYNGKPNIVGRRLFIEA
jgi:hypothetical protein